MRLSSLRVFVARKSWILSRRREVQVRGSIAEMKSCSEVKSCSQLENNFYRGIELENILYRDIENLKISSTIRVGVLK